MDVWPPQSFVNGEGCQSKWEAAQAWQGAQVYLPRRNGMGVQVSLADRSEFQIQVGAHLSNLGHECQFNQELISTCLEEVVPEGSQKGSLDLSMSPSPHKWIQPFSEYKLQERSSGKYGIFILFS